MNIAGREIGPDHPPYIIAEISCNHMGDISIARELIVAAKQAGADAVKFQAYEADTITIDCDNPDFIIKDGPWKGRKLHELYSKAQTPFAWFPQLFAWAKEADITCFASVFDTTSVDMLEGLGCPAYKIASMEIVDIPLIEYAAKTGKPLIISTGMANYEEIQEVLEVRCETCRSCTAFRATRP
jgi:sialic acid synthase SpsE